MIDKEMVAEIRAAAESLATAAAAAENEDLAAAEIGIEDALFRGQSLLNRMRQKQADEQSRASIGGKNSN